MCVSGGGAGEPGDGGDQAQRRHGGTRGPRHPARRGRRLAWRQTRVGWGHRVRGGSHARGAAPSQAADEHQWSVGGQSRWGHCVRACVCEMSLSVCICNIFLCSSSINEQSSALNCKLSITVYFTFQQINMALSLRTSCWSMTNWTNRWGKLLSNMEEVPGRFESFNESKCVLPVTQKRKTSFLYFHTGVIMESDPVLTVFRLMWV